MEVKIHFYAYLKELNKDGKFTIIEIPENSDLSYVFKFFNITNYDEIIVLKNGAKVEIDEIINNNDVLHIFPYIGGG